MKVNDNRPQIDANFKGAKVLLIDDNDDHATLVGLTMQQCLPQVKLVRTATATQTLALLEEWQLQEWELPKLILLDLYLPYSSDGWQLLEQIKQKLPSVCLIPVVMFSGSGLPADVTKAYQLGVASYIVKPINPADWLTFFQQLRTYWWETVSLLPVQYIL